MIDRYIREFILKWVLNYVAKAGLAVDWANVKVKAVAYLAIVPEFVDSFQAKLAPSIPDFLEAPLYKIMDEVALAFKSQCEAIVAETVEVLKDAFADYQNQKELVEAILVQDWQRAYQELKEVLEKRAHPAGGKVLAAMGYDQSSAA